MALCMEGISIEIVEFRKQNSKLNYSYQFLTTHLLVASLFSLCFCFFALFCCR
ncbi:hypothetical protein LINPERHAP2_LOCUS27604 [Linum perenne]